MAWLVTSKPIDMGELWAWAETRMPAFAVPRFIEVVDELPKTPSERVQKVKLRDRGISANTQDRLSHQGA
jgi:crotonobetaine/carnitine-CoA ligase